MPQLPYGQQWLHSMGVDRFIPPLLSISWAALQRKHRASFKGCGFVVMADSWRASWRSKSREARCIWSRVLNTHTHTQIWGVGKEFCFQSLSLIIFHFCILLFSKQHLFWQIEMEKKNNKTTIAGNSFEVKTSSAFLIGATDTRGEPDCKAGCLSWFGCSNHKLNTQLTINSDN